EELAGALNQGGYLIVMTQFPSKSDEAFLDWWYRRDVTHISFFSPRSFAIMASTVGLEVLKQLNDNVVVFHKPC
ncbi:MAG TPA: methyltransferase domain-containing protein, partial [Campylobacterales bacterium]|nr:methyltransferase domain-containing protein [Campylobacterales bacterium]